MRIVINRIQSARAPRELNKLSAGSIPLVRVDGRLRAVLAMYEHDVCANKKYHNFAHNFFFSYAG